MKELLLIIGKLLALVVKVISVALAIAIIILWLIGLLSVTFIDVLILLYAMIGLYIASVIVIEIVEDQDWGKYMNNESNDTYTVVLIPCNNSENVGTYGQYLDNVEVKQYG